MTELGRSAGSNGGRRRKRFRSPSQKYEIWIGLLRGEFSTVEAADRAGVSPGNPSHTPEPDVRRLAMLARNEGVSASAEAAGSRTDRDDRRPANEGPRFADRPLLVSSWGHVVYVAWKRR